MSLAIIDAREWQNQFDLETGRKKEDDSPVIQKMKKVLADNPYPGDVDAAANTWVSNTALDMIQWYRPDLVCLSYVYQFFAGRHFAYSRQEQEKMCRQAVAEAMDFVEKSGYTPVIIGTGGLVPLTGDMDLSGLDGLAISSNWSARYCGLHDPSPSDMATINTLDGMERVVSKKEWIDLFIEAQPDLDMEADEDLIPDYLLVAKQGFAFKTMGTTLRKPVTVPENNFTVPVYTPLGVPKDLRDIRQLIRSSLGSNLGKQKIALILVEGVGQEFFPDNTITCRTGPDWFCYEPGDVFYLTLSTGKHQPFVYPAGFRHFDEDIEHIKFPFSGYLKKVPENTLALDYPGKSIAVGNRSMFMHMMFGADLTVECFARNLFNQGCLGVVHRQDKWEG